MNADTTNFLNADTTNFLNANTTININTANTINTDISDFSSNSEDVTVFSSEINDSSENIVVSTTNYVESSTYSIEKTELISESLLEKTDSNNMNDYIYYDSNKGVYTIQNATNNSEALNIITEELLSSYPPESGKSQTIEGGDGKTIFQITTNKNDLDFLNNPNSSINNHNISIIDLGECEIILRKKYNISENDSLIFVKQQTVSNKVSEKNLRFDVFEPYNKTKLNLTLCSENSINLYVKMELNDDMKDI